MKIKDFKKLISGRDDDTDIFIGESKTSTRSIDISFITFKKIDDGDGEKDIIVLNGL